MSSAAKNGTSGFANIQANEFSLGGNLSSKNKNILASSCEKEGSPDVLNEHGRFKRYNSNITEAKETDERDSSLETEEDD